MTKARSGTALNLGLAALACCAWLPTAGHGQEAETLPPFTILESQLDNGEQRLYRPLLSADRRWAVRLDQLGVDTSLEAAWPTADQALKVDSPLDRDGVEFLLLPADALEGIELTVLGGPTADRPGSYRIQLLALDPARGPPDDPSRQLLSALEAMTEAGRAYALGGGDGRSQALEAYGQGVEAWQQLRRPRLAAQSLYAVAVLHRLLGDTEAGLVAARDVLPLWQSLGDLGRQADTHNEIGLMHSSKGNSDAARQAFEDALEVQQRAGDLFRQSATANNLCLAYLVAAEFRQAVDCYGPALDKIRAAADGETEAVAITNLAWAFRSLGQPEDAFEHLHQAAEMHRTAGREKRHAETLNSLAVLHRQVDEPQAARDLYLQALEIFRRQGSRPWEAGVLHNLGFVYQMLGDPQRARRFFEQAVELKRQLGNVRGEASTLRRLGVIALEAGDLTAAGETLQRVLELEQSTQNRRGEAITRQLIGRVHGELGEHATALKFFDQALSPALGLEERDQVALGLVRRGRSFLALGHLAEARSDFDAAAQEFLRLGQDVGASEALYRLAETELAADRPDVALAHLDRAIELFESKRGAVIDADLRSTFTGLLNGAFSLRLDLLLTRHTQQSDGRWLREAFETSDRAHARSLVEVLRRPRDLSLGKVGSPANNEFDELHQALRRARRRLHLQARKHRKLLAKATATVEDREVAAAEAELLEAWAEVEQRQAEIRKAVPNATTWQEPENLSTAEVQRLLDPKTALLEFALGESRSFVFLVTSTDLQVFELPARDVLEETARRVHLAMGSAQGDGADAQQLAEWLLSPALEDLAAERLVIVADGALHYLPFAALPLPKTAGGGGQRLLQRFEVVHLPAASALAAIRQRSGEGEPARRWAAVLADPVFTSDDLRLGHVVAQATPTDAGSPDVGSAEEASAEEASNLFRGQEHLGRLRKSRREADLVASLAGPDEVLVALGFDANRSLVLSGRLDDFRIVHFATHGVVDAQYPVLSGLALAHFDASGSPVDGFLRLQDIYSLELQADLVILSACRTALGKEVHGEGFLGLMRGFLRAGAHRVVASLWSVPDAATAELMERFYGALAEEGLAPAAALRSAQLSMMQQRRWRGPHNWAAFVVVGDWQGRPLTPPK